MSELTKHRIGMVRNILTHFFTPRDADKDIHAVCDMALRTLDAEKAEAKLREALELLVAEQNGPPLERDKDGWFFAMAKAREAMHSSDAPASEPPSAADVKGILKDEPEDPVEPEKCSYCNGLGYWIHRDSKIPCPQCNADAVVVDRPECSCNPGWPENCPVHGNGELEDVVESDRPQTDAQREALDLMDRIERGYNFQCDAGPLHLCVDWMALRQALSQSGQAVSDQHERSRAEDAVRRLHSAASRFGHHIHNQQADMDKDKEQILALIRALATHPADGDSPAVPDDDEQVAHLHDALLRTDMPRSRGNARALWMVLQQNGYCIAAAPTPDEDGESDETR